MLAHGTGGLVHGEPELTLQSWIVRLPARLVRQLALPGAEGSVLNAGPMFNIGRQALARETVQLLRRSSAIIEVIALTQTYTAEPAAIVDTYELPVMCPD